MPTWPRPPSRSIRSGTSPSDALPSPRWESLRDIASFPKALYTAKGQKFLKNNKNFYFDALGTTIIADMICDAIDLDVEVATAAAEKLYNSGYNEMINYIRDRIGI